MSEADGIIIPAEWLTTSFPHELQEKIGAAALKMLKLNSLKNLGHLGECLFKVRAVCRVLAAHSLFSISSTNTTYIVATHFGENKLGTI